MNSCPWCGAKVVDVSFDDGSFDRRKRYLCTGPDAHEWREGDAPEPDQEPLVVLK